MKSLMCDYDQNVNQIKIKVKHLEISNKIFSIVLGIVTIIFLVHIF